jgi:hypothetical protein
MTPDEANLNEQPPTRGEFDLLHEMQKRDHDRVENIDIHGTRGIGGLQQQVADVRADVVEIKGDLGTIKSDIDRRFDAHEEQHKDAEAARVTSRRWIIMAAIAFGTLLCAMAGAIVDILVQLHG